MKKLAPVATPGFAFHATPANALNLVGAPCINTPTANMARTVSAAY